MTRLDKLAFEYRESEFLKALYDELLTPIAFGQDFGTAEDIQLSSLFADLAPRLVPEGLENDLTATSRVFYEDLIKATQTADFLNGLIEGDIPSADEAALYQRALVNRSLAAISALSSESLQRQFNEVLESGAVQGQGIVDWYAQNYASLINGLGIDPTFMQDLSGVSPYDTFFTHGTNQSTLQREILSIFTNEVDPAQSARPSDNLAWQYASEIDYLSQAIVAYSGDRALDTQVNVQEGLTRLAAWGDLVARIEASIDAYAYAFASGLIENTASGVPNLLRPGETSISGATIKDYIAPGQTIIDPATGTAISGEAFADAYLVGLPTLEEAASAIVPVAEFFKSEIGIDLDPYFLAQTGTVTQFYDGAVFGGLDAPTVFDTGQILVDSIAAAAAAGDGTRGFAFTDFVAFGQANLVPAAPDQPPLIPDAFYTQAQIDGLKEAYRTALQDGLLDTSKVDARTETFGALVDQRQKVIEAYIMATDDARPFYAMQIAVAQQQVEIFQAAVARALQRAVEADPAKQAQLDAYNALFAQSETTAGNLLNAAGAYTGTRTDKPIVRAELPVTEDNLPDLRWTADPVNGEATFNVDAIYGSGDADAGWRTATTPDYFADLLPALAAEAGRQVDVPEGATLFEFETALRAQEGGDAFVDGVDALAQKITAYNTALQAYEVVRASYLRTDPLERTSTWASVDDTVGGSQSLYLAYGEIETALTDLGLDTDFLQTEFDVPPIGGTSGGGEAETFAVLRPADAILVEVEALAVRYDTAVLPVLMQISAGLGFDGALANGWRTDGLADIRQTLGNTISSYDFPGGGEPDYSAGWFDKLSQAILQYNTNVAAYEKAVTYALLSGTDPSTVAQSFPELTNAINIA